MEKYILFCAEEAHFQTRTMLIPYDKYWSNDSLFKWINNLLKISTCDIFTCGYDKVVVDNLIVRESINFQDLEHVDRMIAMASGVDYEDLDEETLDWYGQSYINICNGFDHIANFKKLLKMKEYRKKDIMIVYGILVLDK
jgi:hypothetical protein